MIDSGRGRDHGPPAIYAAAAVAVFAVAAAVRVILYLNRQPFFDELFTVWISRRSWGGIYRSLLVDSGPPLYYLITTIPERLLAGGGSIIADVPRLRTLSLVFGLAPVALILLSRRLGPPRWVAAALLALFPAHVFFSTEARAYALCAMLVGSGVVVLDRWCDEGGRETLAVACGLLVLAGFSHYYGVLFFGAPFLLALLSRSRRRIAESVVATACMAVLYLPGFIMAFHQPSGSISWMAGKEKGALATLIAIGRTLHFAPAAPAMFFSPPPSWLQWTSLGVVAVSVVAGVVRSASARRMAVVTLLPVAIVVAAAAAGKAVYFPLRFESVLAVPLVLWLALSIRTFPAAARSVLLSILLASGAFSVYSAILDQRALEPDSFRSAAVVARTHLPPGSIITASGFSYLEVLSQRDEEWDPVVLPFPPAQGEHPGWYDIAAAGREDGLPIEGGRFFWLGEAGSPELAALAAQYRMRLLARNDSVMLTRSNGPRVRH